MHETTKKVLAGCLFFACLALAPVEKMPADELSRENGDVNHSSTPASDKQPGQQPASSRGRWHIKLDAATRESLASGMPLMIVFR